MIILRFHPRQIRLLENVNYSYKADAITLPIVRSRVAHRRGFFIRALLRVIERMIRHYDFPQPRKTPASAATPDFHP